MRLIETTKLELEEYFGNQVPPYAILSHTWGRGEVSLQEFHDEKADGKYGYAKIKRCCEVAVAQGFKYAWVDTCCIDKSSSAELSEAINSMYRWYQEAEVCYVYLEDVRYSGTWTEDRPTPPNWTKNHSLRADFSKSRWFSRGWTLQELIAPPNLIFFNSNWEEIGTKLSLQEALTDITGIPAQVLLRGDLAESSIAQKMSWASWRETTRSEDMAYCLLGIFDVNMPMLYGEGEYAFIRLQEEIIRNSDDHSIFAWWVPAADVSHVPKGLLASGPSAFRDSKDVICPPKNFSNKRVSIAKGGVEAQMLLKRLGSQDYLGILNCKKKDAAKPKSNMLVGLRLKKTSSGQGDAFERVQHEVIVPVHADELEEAMEEAIFVKQEREKNSISKYSRYAVQISGFIEHTIAMKSCHPPGTIKQTPQGRFGTLGHPLLILSNRSGVFAAIAFETPDRVSFAVVLHIDGAYPGNVEAVVEQWPHTAQGIYRTFRPALNMEDGLDKAFGHVPRPWKGSDRVMWQHPSKTWRVCVGVRREIMNSGGKVWVIDISIAD